MNGYFVVKEFQQYMLMFWLAHINLLKTNWMQSKHLIFKLLSYFQMYIIWCLWDLKYKNTSHLQHNMSVKLLLSYAGPPARTSLEIPAGLS